MKRLWVGIVLVLLGLAGGLFLYLRSSTRAERIQVEDHPEGKRRYRTLLINGINFGAAFETADRQPLAPQPGELPFQRIPTTYYHRHSPVGLVLGPRGSGAEPLPLPCGDVRLPASLAAMLGAEAGSPSVLPLGTLLQTVSEPPVAVVNLTAGTTTAYARPFQWFDVVESNPHIIRLSLPPEGERPAFAYVEDALARGARVHVRLVENGRQGMEVLAPEGFYQTIVVETARNIAHPNTELFTVEGLRMLLGKLRPGGILCLHVSNRHYDLTPALADAAGILGLAVRHGHDQVGSDDMGYTSEWVMLARRAEDLAMLQEPPGYAAAFLRRNPSSAPVPYWRVPPALGGRALHDGNLSALRRLER